MREQPDVINPRINRTLPQVLGPNGWGLLCYSNTPLVTVTVPVGSVICRETRDQFLIRISGETRVSGYTGVYYNGTIGCTGDEASLSECSMKLSKQLLCPDGFTIVDCSPGILVHT